MQMTPQILITALDCQELKIKANNTATQFKNWCASNRLIVNVAKTVCLNFQLRAPVDVFTFEFESTQIVSCEQTKFLGVITDAMLSWNDHMNAVVKSINTACFAIVRLRDALDRSALLSVYYALVHSYLNYAICLWGSATNINRVFVSQKRIIRLIFRLNSRDSCKPYFKMFRILNVPCLFIYKCLILVKSNENAFPKNQEYHGYGTRHASSYAIMRHRCSKFEKSPYYLGIKLFNRLPDSIKQLSLGLFKVRLKCFLIENCFYSIDEYLHSK